MFAFRRTMIRHRVIVTLITGRAFEGVVYARRGPLLILRDAAVLEGSRRIAMDGEVVIERSRIEFVQVAPPPSLIQEVNARDAR